jgi:carbamoylphosphate synthase small subunit
MILATRPDGIMLSNGPRRSWKLQSSNRNNKKII